MKHFITKHSKLLKQIAAFGGLFVLGIAVAHATTGGDLGSLESNIKSAGGDITKIISIGGLLGAFLFGFWAFNHARMHHMEPQGKHMAKCALSAIAAVGFVSVPVALHMLQNSVFAGDNTSDAAWSVANDNSLSSN